VSQCPASEHAKQEEYKVKKMMESKDRQIVELEHQAESQSIIEASLRAEISELCENYKEVQLKFEAEVDNMKAGQQLLSSSKDVIEQEKIELESELQNLQTDHENLKARYDACRQEKSDVEAVKQKLQVETKQIIQQSKEEINDLQSRLMKIDASEHGNAQTLDQLQNELRGKSEVCVVLFIGLIIYWNSCIISLFNILFFYRLLILPTGKCRLGGKS